MITGTMFPKTFLVLKILYLVSADSNPKRFIWNQSLRDFNIKLNEMLSKIVHQITNTMRPILRE